ncbi:MAG: EpsI family protein [Rhodocyclaceae bacterium UTPRO2]|jgi:EpsI family protein|nr:MAG: EpsI family protein [Rhodocyclaceae bacterium UTPRO2]
MTPLLRTGLIIAALMFAASAAAVALRPTHKLADAGPKVNLEAMIPKQFGDWRIDTSIAPVLPAPDVQAKLDKIYNQTIARTYVNGRGQRVMLSIAYGGDQSDAMQVHKPEVCYAAQGFQIKQASLGQLATEYGELPVKRLVATLNNRVEPITYWITVGDQVINAGYKQKIAQLKYGLNGNVPDGMLVRASSIDRDEKNAYELQEGFLRKMLAAMPPADRARLGGSGVSQL